MRFYSLLGGSSWLVCGLLLLVAGPVVELELVLPVPPAPVVAVVTLSSTVPTLRMRTIVQPRAAQAPCPVQQRRRR